MRDMQAGLLHRVYSYWAGPWRVPHNIAGIAVTMYAAIQHPADSKKACLPAKSAGVAPSSSVLFLSLPDSIQEEILKQLPTKDRLAHVPLVCTQLATAARRASPIWEEVVIEAEVIGTCLKLDILESWLTVRGSAVRSLTVAGLKTWSENSDAGQIALLSCGAMPKVFTPCRVTLQSLTVTDCGSLFAQEDFAALALLCHLQHLCIETAAQVHPCDLHALSALTLLNSLSLTVSPGDRMNFSTASEYFGFPTAVESLTALTRLRLSGWHFVGAIPERIGRLTALKELTCSNCVATSLPASLQKLSNLECIDLSSNALGRAEDSTPADCLLNASKLTAIRLSGNWYPAVPTYLSSVTALQSLHLTNCDIGSGSTTCLSHVTALTKLVMQQCNLNCVPDSLTALSSLQWLCLSRNNLESIPDGMPWLQLKLLHLRGNILKAVPCHELSKAACLQTIDCGDNIPMQIDDYLKVWNLVKQLPDMEYLFIAKDGIPEQKWSKDSLSQIASLRKIIKKKKRRCCLN